MRHIFSRYGDLDRRSRYDGKAIRFSHARRLIQIPVCAQRDLEAFRLFAADADMILVADSRHDGLIHFQSGLR